MGEKFKFEKKVYRGWCSWCCERFRSPSPKVFCGKHCTWLWMEAKARKLSEPVAPAEDQQAQALRSA